MGVGKIVADVGGGVVTKKVVDKVLDNEGDNKSFGKSAASIGAGVVAAKVIDDTLDKREEAKEQQKDGDGFGVGTVALAAGAGYAVSHMVDKAEMKKMTQEGMQADKSAARANPFATQPVAAKLPTQQAQPQNSFETAVKEQMQNIQQGVDNKGMNQQAVEAGQELSV